jgi:pyruvate/2-oxoacid:ferredoxin oxidoreductase beta subunit
MNHLLQYTRKRIFIFLFFSLATPSLLAQDKQEGDSDCSVKLQEGEAAYEDGSLSTSIALLEECVKSGGFNNEEKVRAYRLLTIIYLYKNQEDKASEYMQSMLKTNPEYHLRPNDPAEFVELYKQYKIIPYLIVGGGAGANLSMLKITKLYSTDNPENQNMVYNSLLGFQVGLNVAKPITNKIEILANPTFVVLKYRFEASYFDYASLIFTESQTRVEMPILLKYNLKNKYNFSLGGIKPYFVVGATPNLILSASGNAQRTDFVSEDQSRSVEGKAIPMTALRNKLTFSAVAGVGAEYKIGLGHLFVDIRYQYAFMNMVNGVNRYSLQNEIAKYGYIDNDYTMGALMISAGYNYPLYNPKKKKSKIKKASEEIKIETNN